MAGEHCPCTGWCVTYQVQPGERHHRDCKHWNRQHHGAEVFQTRTELIVTGDPGHDENHNCDALGCSSVSHVLFRFPLAPGVNPSDGNQPKEPK
jgi:hypothetical protein